MKPEAPVTSARIGSPYRRTISTHWVPATAVLIIVGQLAARGVLAFGGYFYWDDLILVSRAGTQDLLSWRYLFDDHDGHVMPGAFLVAGAVTRAAPLVWLWPAVSLIVMQALASLALLRTLHVILGWRPVLLIPLTFALFTPLGIPGFAWWAAALNSLPMLAALAWVCGDAILLVRTGNRRYAISGLLVFLGGLLFFEKAAVIPFVAFALTSLLAYVGGDDEPWRPVWNAGYRLWTTSLALLAGWIALYLVVVDQRRWSSDLSMTWDLLRRSVTHAIVPGLAGGPWDWQRIQPASPWGTPGLLVMALGWLTLAAVVAVSFRRKLRIKPVWVAAVGYAVACQVPIYLMRSSQFTALVLPQALRYLPDLVIVLALLAAVAFCAPNRTDSARLDASVLRTVVVTALAAAFVGSSLYSTWTYLISWRDSPTRGYLENAQATMAQAPRDIDILDQEINPQVLSGVAWPENMASHVFALIDDRPEFSLSTPILKVFARDGNLVDGNVTWVRTIEAGPVPRCGYLVQPGAPVAMALDGPLLPTAWTAELNYLANIDGSITFEMVDGDPVKVSVTPGLNRIFVRVSGSGDRIAVFADTSALSICISSGPIGHVLPK